MKVVAWVEISRYAGHPKCQDSVEIPFNRVDSLIATKISEYSEA